MGENRQKRVLHHALHWLQWLRRPLGPPPRAGDALAWAAVWLSAGIFLWFALPNPPRPWLAGATASAMLAMRLWRWRQGAMALATSAGAGQGGRLAWLPRTGSAMLLPLALIALGLTLTGWRIGVQQTPMLPANVGSVQLTGVVEQVRMHRPTQARIVVRVLHLDRVQRRYWPRRARLTVTGLGRKGAPGHAVLPLPGDVVRMPARLLRLPKPVEPGAFDPARDLYMAGIGAVGFASARSISVLRRDCGTAPSGVEAQDICGPWLWLERRLERMRRAVAAAFDAHMSDATAAALAKALTIGARGALPAELREDLRAAGLAHILAISGLHLALLAGAVFWLVRAGLALIPALALRWPLKKVAAVSAWLVALAYLLLSGNSVATQRAFVMLSVALLAVLLERPAISMRNLALAALFILLLWPHKALSAGFQMSFLAVMGLIAGYEAVNWWRRQRREIIRAAADDEERDDAAGRRIMAAAWWGRAGRWLLAAVGGLVFTTVIASFYTALPAAWHFNRLPLHGLWGNLAALPLLSMLVMPAGLLALALLPLLAVLRALDMEALADALLSAPLALMQWGLQKMVAAAQAIAALPDGWWHIRQLSASATLLLAIGLLWLALRNDRLRLLGLLPPLLVFSGLWPAFAPRPDVLVEERARLVAIRTADGRLAATPGRGGGFALRIWLRRDGDASAPKQARRRGAWTCDAFICRARLTDGTPVLYLRDVFRRGGSPAGRRAAAEGAASSVREKRLQALERMQRACATASIVIAAFPLRGLCRADVAGSETAPAVVIDRFDVWRAGAHALWRGADGGWRLRAAARAGGALPWRRAPLARWRVMRR